MNSFKGPLRMSQAKALPVRQSHGQVGLDLLEENPLLLFQLRPSRVSAGTNEHF